MSLNFDLKAAKANLGDEKFALITTSPETRGLPEDQQKWHPVTNALIWMSMGVDLGEITDANIDEWCFRVGLLQKLGEPEISGSLGSFSITRNDIENHVGMHTNVTTKKRAAWLDRVLGKKGYEASRVILKKVARSAVEEIDAAIAAASAKK